MDTHTQTHMHAHTQTHTHTHRYIQATTNRNTAVQRFYIKQQPKNEHACQKDTFFHKGDCTPCKNTTITLLTADSLVLNKKT